MMTQKEYILPRSACSKCCVTIISYLPICLRPVCARMYVLCSGKAASALRKKRSAVETGDVTARTAIEHDGKPIRFCNNTNLQQALRPVRLEPSSLKMNCSITDYSQPSLVLAISLHNTSVQRNMGTNDN